MCKKSLLMMLLLALLVPWAANAQTSLFSEDFEGGTMPAGWTTDGPGSWSVGVGDYSTSTGAGHGSYNAKITHGSTGNVTKLITPEIDLSSVASAELSFMHVQRSWAGDIDQLRVYYRTSSSGSWTQIAEYTAAFASWTTEDGIVLPNLSSTYQIAFEHTDKYGYGVGVDNIVIVQGASCPKPADLAATPNGQSATLTWTSDASSFDVAYSADGTANPDDLTYTTVTTNSYTKDNLAIDADHYFWVRANCSGTDQSAWAGPVSVHIGYCVPAPTSVDGNGISNVTFGIDDYVVNNETPKATYADYSNLVGAVRAGVEATIAITFKTGYTYNTYVWVDLDNSLSFDADEVVCYGESTSSNPTTLTLNFTIPADQTLGDFRLRIGSADSGLGSDPTAANPCYTGFYGCFQDYTLRVLEAPSCLPPTGLTVSDVTAHTANISWTSDGNAWQIGYSTDGFVTEQYVDVTETSYTLTGLAPETAYQVRVQNNCGGGTYSVFTNPVSFTTGIACPAPTGLATSNLTGHGATITWTAEEGALYQSALVKTAEYDANNITWSESFEGNSQTWNNLDPETGYTFALRKDCGSEDGYSTVVTRTFTTTVACPAPTVEVTNITTTTADVRCTNTDASAFNVQLINPNATPADTTLFENVAMPYTLTGLTQNTSYRVRVQALCGGDGESAWSNGTNFMTAEECPDGMVCIGAGTATSSYVPVTTCYNYSLSQQIYTAAEIGEAGAILSIDFYSTNGATKARNFDIYMVSTDKSRFENTTDWIAVTAADLVYSATNYTWQTGWNSFELDVPFVYDGTSNVAIVVNDEKVTSYECSVNFRVFEATGQAIYARNDDDGPYDPFNTSYTAYGLLNTKNRIRLAIGEPPACPKPTQLAVNYEGGTEATISWTSDAEAWNMRVNGTPINGTITNPYTLTGLELATTYEVEVQANCGDATSEWAGPVSFTTDACMPEDMTVINYELEDSYGDGWNSNYILVVDGDCNLVEALTITSGNSASGTLKVCGQYVSFMWYNGNYADETSWTFTDAEGTVLFSGTGSSSMQNYDVLYVYDHESVKRPSDLVVHEDAIGPYGAKLSWTENGTATAWQIGVYDEEETLVNTVDANSNPFMLTGLQAETTYIVKVRSVTSAGQSAWTCPGVGFTTGVACGAPSALDVTPYPITADVNWTVFEEGYDIEWTEVSAAKDGGLWLQYDNGINYTNIGGTTSGVRTWGVMYPAAMLEGNKNLTKVAVYENATYYTCESYTINIYQGINQPETLVGTETVVPTGESGMHEITLTAPITLDLTQNLWITMTVEGTYVMPACQSTERNNQWWDNNADGVWTNMGDDSSNLAGYGWMIRGYVEGYDPADFNWTSETNVLPPYTIESLSPETTYFVRVKASCGTDWIWAQFTTPSACDAPVNLTAVAEATSATLNWVGYQDSYNVQYRTAVKYIPVWEYDFENGIDSTWTIVAGDGATHPAAGIWYTINPISGLNFNAHSGTQCASSWSWNSDAYHADNWLITPQLDLQGVLKYYVRTSSGYPDSYEVLLSTTDAETTSFTVTLQAMAPAPANGEWNEVVIDLSAYAGRQGYIAIHHVDYDMNYLCIDDLGIYTPEAAGAWIPVTVNEPTCTLTGLTPETDYEWQVQGVNASCDGGLTEWSEIQNFTTLEQTLVTQTTELATGWNWFSTYIDASGDQGQNILNQLKECLGTNGLQIRTQGGGITYRNGRWWGSITINNVRGYQIKTSAPVTITITGTGYANPEECEITINENWNWIGYPVSESQTVTNAFADFQPNTNDQIKTSGGGATYRAGRWMPNNFTLEPGKSYLYKSSSTEQKTLVFPNVNRKAETMPATVINKTVINKKVESKPVQKAKGINKEFKSINKINNNLKIK